jgi:hypothetical protein
VKTKRPEVVGNMTVTEDGKTNTLLGLHAVFPFPEVTKGPSEYLTEFPSAAQTHPKWYESAVIPTGGGSFSLLIGASINSLR